jgi:hypothetical protein
MPDDIACIVENLLENVGTHHPSKYAKPTGLKSDDVM